MDIIPGRKVLEGAPRRLQPKTDDDDDGPMLRRVLKKVHEPCHETKLITYYIVWLYEHGEIVYFVNAYTVDYSLLPESNSEKELFIFTRFLCLKNQPRATDLFLFNSLIRIHLQHV